MSRVDWRIVLLLAALALPACSRPRPAVPAGVEPQPDGDAPDGPIPPPRPAPAAAEPADAKDAKNAMEVSVSVDPRGVWGVRYPQGQSLLLGGNTKAMSEDERNRLGRLVLPAGRPVKLTVAGKGGAQFSIDQFPVELHVPAGQTRSASVVPKREGDLECRSGPEVIGSVRVVPEGEFEDFLNGLFSHRGPDTPADGSLARKGRNEFLRQQCNVCHSGDAGAKGPNLEGIFGTRRKVRVPQPDGKHESREITVDDAYIIESIIDPKARVAEAWEPIMPEGYADRTTPEERSALVEFIKGLKRGDLPKRIKPFPAPVGAPKDPVEAAPAPREKRRR